MNGTPPGAVSALGAAFGHEFLDHEAFERALTHRSAGQDSNERLEFLGDAVLGLAIAELLYGRRSTAAEGELTRTRASLVSNEALAAAARETGLGDHLVLGAGERRSGGRDRDSILAGALEALFAVMYLEAGYEATRSAVERMFAGRLERAAAGGPPKDPKTKLQELLQARGLDLPRYRIVDRSGTAHRPRFRAVCEFGAGEGQVTRGEGSSRRHAEQRAAERALTELVR